MEILLLQASAYELPTSRRVGVIVHDGATDARLWPGPGADRDLFAAYGSDLQTMLERECQKLPERSLDVGGIARVHPGRLHCDFMMWTASRGPEQGGRQAPAPGKDVLEGIVRSVLDFVAERNVIRIAFPALGGGPEALDEAERLAIIARACAAWQESRFAAGLPNPIEEVMVCDPRLSVVTAARKRVASLVKAPPAEPRPAAPEARAAGERRPARAAAPRGAGRAAGAARGAAAARKPRLDEAELQRARATARPWDRAVTYRVGAWFVHSKFGVGQVQDASNEGKVTVLFEDGESRTLIHAR